MYILNNAAKNLLRNKGRNLIVAIIMLAMLTATAVSMIINTTGDNIIKDIKNRFGSEVYIQTDVEKFKEMSEGQTGMVTVPDISDGLKLTLAESEYLKESRLIFIFSSYAPDLTGLDQGENSSGGNIEYKPQGNSEYYDANTNVIGYSDFGTVEDFKEGVRQITEGSFPENQGEAMVSEDFAKLNHLKLGDTVAFRSTKQADKFEKLKLKIVGIYFDTKKSAFGDWVSAATNPKNDIITSSETLMNYQKNIAGEEKIISVSATYFLKNPNHLEAFNKEAHQKGLSDIFVMSTDELSYNQIVKPVEGLSQTSMIFLILVLCFGSVILILLSFLSIRERKYEIGVLRAMGMKKIQVVRGIIYESLITIVLCLVIGLSIGAAVAQPVSDRMLENQIETLAENDPFGTTNTALSEVNVSLSTEAAASVAGIAIILALLSSAAGIFYITRYEPMKILSERN